MVPEISFMDDQIPATTGPCAQTNVDVVIESSGRQVVAEMSEEQLSQHYNRQLPNFPEECKNNIKSFLTNGDEIIHSTTVMQRHLMPALNTPGKLNKYVAPAAKFFMRKLEEKGMCTVSNVGKKSIQYQKRKWENLHDSAISLLNASGVTHSAYTAKRKKISNV
jgi:hypothetical protein